MVSYIIEILLNDTTVLTVFYTVWNLVNMKLIYISINVIGKYMKLLVL